MIDALADPGPLVVLVTLPVVALEFKLAVLSVAPDLPEEAVAVELPEVPDLPEDVAVDPPVLPEPLTPPGAAIPAEPRG